MVSSNPNLSMKAIISGPRICKRQAVARSLGFAKVEPLGVGHTSSKRRCYSQP